MLGPYLFIAAQDWILATGYPIDGDYDADEFDGSLKEAVRRTGAKDCCAIAPSLPQRLAAHRVDLDHYHTLPANVQIPGRLLNYARQAGTFGNVSPCVFLNIPAAERDPHRLVFGNLHREDARTIWESDVFRRFREGLAQDRPDPRCVTCVKRFEC